MSLGNGFSVLIAAEFCVRAANKTLREGWGLETSLSARPSPCSATTRGLRNFHTLLVGQEVVRFLGEVHLYDF